MNHVIAERCIIVQYADRTEVEAVVQIGEPTETDDGDWSCAVQITGIDRERRILGADRHQSVVLASEFLLSRLNQLAKGGAAILSLPGRAPISPQQAVPHVGLSNPPS